MQAIHQTGLNTAAGFLHTCRDSDSSLTYDIVEEFRSAVVDRAVFSLLNRNQKLTMGEDDLLIPETRKKLTLAVLRRLGQTVKTRGNSITLQRIIHSQVQAIKDYLLEKAAYRPFLAQW